MVSLRDWWNILRAMSWSIQHLPQVKSYLVHALCKGWNHRRTWAKYRRLLSTWAAVQHHCALMRCSSKTLNPPVWPGCRFSLQQELKAEKMDGDVIWRKIYEAKRKRNHKRFSWGKTPEIAWVTSRVSEGIATMSQNVLRCAKTPMMNVIVYICFSTCACLWYVKEGILLWREMSETKLLLL